MTDPITTKGEDVVERETLEQYGDRIAAKVRRVMMDRLDDDVIGYLGQSHIVFGKACAMEAVTTAMQEVGTLATQANAETRAAPPTSGVSDSAVERLRGAANRKLGFTRSIPADLVTVAAADLKALLDAHAAALAKPSADTGVDHIADAGKLIGDTGAEELEAQSEVEQLAPLVRDLLEWRDTGRLKDDGPLETYARLVGYSVRRTEDKVVRDALDCIAALSPAALPSTGDGS